MKYLDGITLLAGIGFITYGLYFEKSIVTNTVPPHKQEQTVGGIQPPYPYIDPNTEEGRIETLSNLIVSLTDRIDMENYYGDKDEKAGYPRRFGPTKQRNYYIKRMIQSNPCFEKYIGNVDKVVE